MSDDSVKPSVYKIRKTGDRKERPRRDEADFLRLTTVEPGYEFPNAFGLKVPYKTIRFDPGNDRRKTHIELASHNPSVAGHRGERDTKVRPSHARPAENPSGLGAETRGTRVQRAENMRYL